MVGEIRDGFQFDAIHFPYYRKDAISVIADMHTVEEYANYINEHGIEQAEIVMPNLDILKLCQSLKHLRVLPPHNAPTDFDFSPLYEMSEIKSIHCVSTWGNREQYVGKIDYSKLNGLVYLSFEANRGL